MSVLSFRALLVLTMLVTFGLSLGVMLWQRSAEAPPAIAATRANPQVAPSMQAPKSLAQSVARPLPVKQEPKPASVPIAASLPTPADPDRMPVDVVFRHRDRLNKFEGRIVNTSGQPLTIEVRVLSASTHYTTQAQVSVGANIQTRFGIDDGLDMQSGDQVTLRSYPFRDQTVQIP
jgi:hypothetical protein